MRCPLWLNCAPLSPLYRGKTSLQFKLIDHKFIKQQMYGEVCLDLLGPCIILLCSR